MSGVRAAGIALLLGRSGLPALPGTRRHWSLEALVFLAYLAVYWAFLFWVWPENEWAHWGSLVVVPLLIVVRMRVRVDPARLRGALATVGLRRGNLTGGLLLGLLVGAGVGVLMIWAQDGFGRVADMAASGKLFWFFPFAFVLMIVTAATTEEFFFRGVLQTRLALWTGKPWLAVLIVAVLFGLYHVPYAYLVAEWPSHGDLAAAFRSGLAEGGIGGLLLGFVYAQSRNNLLASILAHALFNSIGGLLWLNIWGISA